MKQPLRNGSIIPKASLELLLAVTWLGLGISIIYGCTPTEEPQVFALFYSSFEDCVKDVRLSERVCRQEWNRAKLVHQQSAPTYESMEDCQKDIESSSCETINYQGKILYRPIMSGFIVDSTIESPTRAVSGVILTQPIYGSQRAYWSAHGTRVDLYNKSIVKVDKASAMTKPISRGTITRGFGSSFKSSSS